MHTIKHTKIGISVVAACVLLAANVPGYVGKRQESDTTSSSPPSTDSPPRPPDALDRLMKPEAQREMGLQKLTEEERARLIDLMATLATEDALSQAAVAHMEAEGFQRVTVHGTRDLKLSKFGFRQVYLIIEDRFGTLWACDDIIATSSPGRYWAEVKAFGPWRIIDRRGVSHRILSAEELR